MEIPGVICLNLSEVVGPTHSYESFNTNTHQQVDAYAEGNSANACVVYSRQILVTCRRDSGHREIYGGDELDKILRNYF